MAGKPFKGSLGPILIQEVSIQVTGSYLYTRLGKKVPTFLTYIHLHLPSPLKPNKNRCLILPTRVVDFKENFDTIPNGNYMDV